MKNRCGFVSIIGRPNVGKSTLLNRLIGQKIAITTDKPQTTRNRILGIFSSEKGQIIFVDTPGCHRPLNNLGNYLIDEIKYSVENTDIILFMVDGTNPAGAGDEWIVKNLIKENSSVIIVLNKIDLIKNLEKREANIYSYKKLFDRNLPCVKVSAATGRNIDTLISNIYRKLPEGENLYDEEECTNQSQREIVKEIVREKVLENTSDEIPHCVAVMIDKYVEKEVIDEVFVTVYVEQESQKGILIGKAGSMLKKIGQSARIELEDVFSKKIFLELNVKVKKNWRKNKLALKEFGYDSVKD